MISSEGVYKAREDVICRTIENESVLILPEEGSFVVINAIGAFIWQRLDGHRTLAQIVDEIMDTYDVSREQARGDCVAFVTALMERGLVTTSQVRASSS